MIQLRILVAAILLLNVCGVARVEARTISGDVNTVLDTHYVTRFVFQPNEEGTFKFRVKFRKYIDESVQQTPSNVSAQHLPSQHRQSSRWQSNNLFVPKKESGHKKDARLLPRNDYYRIVIYNDKPEQWPYVRKNEDKLTCWEKQQVAINGGILISLSPEHGCTETVENGIPYIVCDNQRSWKDFNRPRWWYITVQNCGTYREPGITLSYEFTMTNGNSYLMKHFSADEQIILPTNIFFLAVYCGVMIVSFIYRYILKNRRMLHSTYQLHLLSVNVQFIGLICMVLAQMNFAKTGILTLEWLETTGHIMTSISMLIYILDAILIAKGFTVTRAKISTSGCIKITLVTVVYTIATAIQYLYQHVLSDERDVSNINEIPAAYAEIGLRMFGLAWIYYGITISVKHFPGKGRFYCYFGIFFTAWFLSEPLMILLTNYTVASHSRAQIVNFAYMTMILFGHISWLVLFFPQKYNKLFPYHLRANQVGILQIGDVENSCEKYSDDANIENLDGTANNITCECETARSASVRAREAGRPLPQYNNFFQDSACSAAAIPETPAAPVFVVPVQNVSIPRPGWDIFLASSLATAQAATPDNIPQAPAAGATPVPTSQSAVIQTTPVRPQPLITPANKPTSFNSILPHVFVPKPESKISPPVCRDFSLFQASSMQPQADSHSQSQEQANTAAPLNNVNAENSPKTEEYQAALESVKEQNTVKTEEFQPASTSSSLSTITLN